MENSIPTFESFFFIWSVNCASHVLVSLVSNMYELSFSFQICREDEALIDI